MSQSTPSGSTGYFFIRRPVFAGVISIVITLLCAAALCAIALVLFDRRDVETG